MNKKKSFASGVNIGSSSILVTFVLLCLVTFAALSFVSANADNRLAHQTAERVFGYYMANNAAEEHLKYADTALKEHFRETADEESFYEGIEELFTYYQLINVVREGEDVFLDFTSTINAAKNQTLNVRLRVIYPESANDEFFEIVKWETNTEYVEEDIPGSEESGFLF